MLDRALCSGFGLITIAPNDDAGISVATVVAFENPPTPSHPAANRVFSKLISVAAVGKLRGPNMAQPPGNF
jgi:hypothetical protein